MKGKNNSSIKIKKDFRKFATASFLITSSLVTTGCSVLEKKDIRCSYKEVTRPDGSKEVIYSCETKTPNETTSILRPIINILAASGFFTIEDWMGFDVSTLELELAEPNSTTTFQNNAATVKIFSNGITVGEKIFEVSKTGNKYKFVDPEQVKSWSLDFVDIADNASVDLLPVTTGDNGATTTAIVRQDSQVLNVTSWQSVPDGPSGPPSPWDGFDGF